ncbi:MAG: hypothetical protein J7L14_00700 [Candidatus Diapherotrites archaeon]|nr:hypothetical protein [Candidatus Diapherotrites archaeon]
MLINMPEKQGIVIKLAALIFLFLLVGNSLALRYDITEHQIKVSVDEQGYASIEERFYLKFPNYYHVEEFKKQSLKYGIKLDEWQKFDQRFKTYVGNPRAVTNAIVQPLITSDSKYFLRITYSLSEPIMEKKREGSRTVEFSLKPNIFREFFSGSLWVIPERTVIEITLPKLVEVKEEAIEPDAIVRGNVIIWQGYKSANTITLSYTLLKQIAPNISLAKLLLELTSLERLPLTILLVTFVIAIIYWQRRKIVGNIENYIIENTKVLEESERE